MSDPGLPAHRRDLASALASCQTENGWGAAPWRRLSSGRQAPGDRRPPRHRSMTARFETERGRVQTIERAPEAVSELLQQELDHLDGVLMTDRRTPGDIDLPRGVARR